MKEKQKRYNSWDKLLKQLETFSDNAWDWKCYKGYFASKILWSEVWLEVTTDNSFKCYVVKDGYRILIGCSDTLLSKALLQTQNNEFAIKLFKNLSYDVGREIMKNNVQVETFMLPENETNEDDLNFNKEELETMARNVSAKNSDLNYTRNEATDFIDALVPSVKRKPSKEDQEEANEFSRKREESRQKAYIGKGCGQRRMNV